MEVSGDETANRWPKIGAISVGMLSQAMAETISRLGITRSRISRPTGSIIAPPRPWQNRPAIKLCRSPASAQATEAAVKTAIDVANTVLAP